MTAEQSYELGRAQQIARFATAPPSLVARGFGRALAPASRAAQNLIPVSALQSVLQGSHSVARWQFHQRLPRPRPGETLEACDLQARNVERVSMALAGGVGAATGVAGGVGVAVDTTVILTLALACIERTAHCYGFGDGEHADPTATIGIFALASANTLQEKRHALRALDADPGSLTEAAARDGLERAAQRQVAKDATQVTLTQLARQIGVHLGRRKAGQLIPLIGSVVGLSVNALYLRDVARAAQHVFALRYLIVHGEKVTGRAALAAAVRRPAVPALPPETAGSSASAVPGAGAIPAPSGPPRNGH